MRDAWIGMETGKNRHCLACYRRGSYPDFAWKNGYAEDDDGHRSLVARRGQSKAPTSLAQSFSQSDCCDTAVDCAEPAACASGGTFRQIVQRPFNISGTTNRERASLRSMSINR